MPPRAVPRMRWGQLEQIRLSPRGCGKISRRHLGTPSMKQVAPSAILTSAEQILAKLRWEIDALRAEGDETIGKYRNWNCVVTAWHAVEILHKTMPDSERQRLAAVIGFDVVGKDGLQQF